MRPTAAFAAALSAALALPGLAQEPVPQGPPAADFEPAFPAQTRAPQQDSGVELERKTVADGFVHPWAVAEIPDGRLLVTERPGRLRMIGHDGSVSAPIDGLPEVFAQDQGGLLDVAVAPDFSESRRIYWTFSEPRGDEGNGTTLARGRLSEDESRVEEVEILFRAEPAWPNAMHYGSRIAFDGEGRLFVTTGERFGVEPRQLAQDLSTHLGKVMRLELDGSVPEGNPFAGDDEPETRPEIWSYGHRNVQAATWDAENDRLIIVEHGPKGGDEVNVARPGENYGWPVISYGVNYDGSDVGEGISKHEGMEQPVYYWDPVIAPSGADIYRGDMFPEWEGDLLIGGLVAEAIVRLDLEDGRVQGEERLIEGVGRVRDVTVGSDGALLVAIDAEDAPILRVTRAD
mgnify:CR=1 FL=1